MLARVIAIATCLSVCSSVCPSDTRRYYVKTKKASGIISSTDVINVKIIIINVSKRVYSEKIVNVCKLKVNVHRE